MLFLLFLLYSSKTRIIGCGIASCTIVSYKTIDCKIFSNIIFIFWTSIRVKDILVFIGQLLVDIAFLFWLDIYKVIAFCIVCLNNIVIYSKLVNHIA